MKADVWKFTTILEFCFKCEKCNCPHTIKYVVPDTNIVPTNFNVQCSKCGEMNNVEA